MKFMYLRLKGYAGIYHGMELEEIYIDFSKFRSNIILIQGDNGCGKSTIINALSVEIDNSDDYRTDSFYDPNTGEVTNIDAAAEKELHLLDGEDFYKILIISAVSNGKRKTTKAFISRNGEELNPNGNVSSYKDIKNSILDMDPNYVLLSYASSENKGLVEMIPSERKRFLSNVISSLEFFNNSYKNLSKKSSTLNSNINNLKSKIYNIGDIDNIVTTLSASNARLFDIDNRRKLLIDNIAESKATIRILDPDNKIQDLYKSILNQLEDINYHINKYMLLQEDLSRKFSKSYQNDILVEKDNLEKAIKETESMINSKNNKVSMNLLNINNLKSMIDSSNQKITVIQSENIKDDIVDLVVDTKEQISLYEIALQNYDIHPDLTKSELFSIKNILSDIKLSIGNIQDNYNDLLEETISYINKKIDLHNVNVDNNNKIEYLKERKSQINIELNYITDMIDSVSILDNRPLDCTNNECGFIKDAFEVYQNIDKYLEQKDSLQVELNDIETDIEKAELFRDRLINILKIHTDICSLLSYINHNNLSFKKMGKICENILSDQFLNKILNHYNFDEFLLIDECIGMVDIENQCKELKSLLIKYEADLRIYNNNQSMINSLSEDVKKYQEQIDTLNNELNYIRSDIKFDNDIISIMNHDKQIMIDIIEAKNNITEYKKQKKLLGEQFNRVKDSIASVKEHVDLLSQYENSLILLDNEYIPLKDNIDKMKFSLAQLQSYQNELKSIQDQYDKIDFIKKSCGPSSNDSIQRIYISMYMTTTIVIANELLSYLFGGALQLMKPIIDDGFSIPFINDFGKQISDISKGSSSQKAMFGMCLGFALLSQGSSKYNILRLDETDRGLDTNNRMQFLPVIFRIMDIMQVQQTFVCSHNIENNTENIDTIYLSKNGIQIHIK